MSDTNEQKLKRLNDARKTREKLLIELALQRRERAQKLSSDPYRLAMKVVEIEDRLDNMMELFDNGELSNPTKEIK